MGELELVGLHEDGEHLVLVAPDGARFRVRIDEPLRAAVRRDRPQLEQLRAESAGTLSPREIQARIRAGATTQEVADSAGLPVERVRRYEGPVLAEREHVAEQARGTRVGRDVGAPTLGDLVTDRLAARGVDLGLARVGRRPRRRPGRGSSSRGSPWATPSTRRAGPSTWPSARSSPTRTRRAGCPRPSSPDEPVSRRHLAAVRDVVFDFQGDGTPARPRRTRPADEPEPVPDPQEETASLLDDLRSRRGVRQAVELDDDDSEEFEGFGPQHAFDFGRPDASVPGAHPVDADPAAEAQVYPAPVAVPGAGHHARGRRRARRQRAPAVAPRSRQGAQLGRDRLRREARVAASGPRQAELLRGASASAGSARTRGRWRRSCAACGAGGTGPRSRPRRHRPRRRRRPPARPRRPWSRRWCGRCASRVRRTSTARGPAGSRPGRPARPAGRHRGTAGRGSRSRCRTRRRRRRARRPPGPAAPPASAV